MFRLVDADTGETVGTAEKLRYIRKSANGSFVQAKKVEDAQGVAYANTAYNLVGRSGLGVEKTVRVIEFDAGMENDRLSTVVEEQNKTIDSLVVTMLEG